MNPVKTTLVGCGAVAQNLYRKPLRVLEKQGLVQVVGLVDRSRAHAEKLLATFPRARVSDDLAENLQYTGSEWTLVLSPPHLHAAHAIAALRLGNHVLCEKPMATSSVQGAEMIAAARTADRVLATGMIRRFFPAFVKLKEILDRGDLGDVQSFAYREGKVFDWDVTTPAGFTRTADGGGGVLLDIGVHALDYLTWLFGPLDPVSFADDGVGGTEGNATMALEAAACEGTVQLSWDSPLRNELRVEGTRATAVLRVDETDRLAIRPRGGAFGEVDTTVRFAADVRAQARSLLCPRVYTQTMLCQLVQGVRAIRLGEPPAVSGEAGLACIGLMEKARRIAEPLVFPWQSPADLRPLPTSHRSIL